MTDKKQPRKGMDELKELTNDILFEFFNEEKIIELCRSLYKKALDGDVEAIKAIFDRMMGKPKQAMDLNLERPIKFVLVNENKDELPGSADTSNNQIQSPQASVPQSN